MRNEGTELESAVKEALAIGEAAQCPVEISHLKVDAPSRWGASAKALAMIDAARAKGMKVAGRRLSLRRRELVRSASAFRRGCSKAARTRSTSGWTMRQRGRGSRRR